MTILKRGCRWFQLFYFLTRIIPEFACHAVILSSSESIVAVITASHICLDCYTMQLLKENRQKEKRTKENGQKNMQ